MADYVIRFVKKEWQASRRVNCGRLFMTFEATPEEKANGPEHTKSTQKFYVDLYASRSAPWDLQLQDDEEKFLQLYQAARKTLERDGLPSDQTKEIILSSDDEFLGDLFDSENVNPSEPFVISGGPTIGF